MFEGWDSVFGIKTHHWLDGPGIESLKGEFSAPIQPGTETHLASYTMGTGSFPAVKCLGHSLKQTSPTIVKIKERVKIYIYSPSVPFIASCRVNITLLLLTFWFVLPICYWHTNVSH